MRFRSVCRAAVCASLTHFCSAALLPQVLTQPATADADEQLVSVRDTLLTLPEEVIQDVGLEVGAGADAGGAHQPGLQCLEAGGGGCQHAVSLEHHLTGTCCRWDVIPCPLTEHRGIAMTSLQQVPLSCRSAWS